MTQNAINFIKKVSSDPSLKAKVLDLHQKNQKSEIEKIAKELGLPCSYEDICAEFNNVQLNDEDLLKIAGGGGASSTKRANGPRGGHPHLPIG